MKKSNIKILFVYLAGVLSSLVAQEFGNTSYYVAFDQNDSTQYVLIMPTVSKVYTHQAGHILPSDLVQIDNQFVQFPSYANSELCFSSLKMGEEGRNGAKIMANKCYEVKFFYIQKEMTEEGMAFILTYTPLDRVYEGIAGKSDSFKIVKDGNLLFNERSISGADYTTFHFDSDSSTVYFDRILNDVALKYPPTTDNLPLIPTI